jgi:hypothetical protein
MVMLYNAGKHVTFLFLLSGNDMEEYNVPVLFIVEA